MPKSMRRDDSSKSIAVLEGFVNCNTALSCCIAGNSFGRKRERPLLFLQAQKQKRTNFLYNCWWVRGGRRTARPLFLQLLRTCCKKTGNFNGGGGTFVLYCWKFVRTQKGASAFVFASAKTKDNEFLIQPLVGVWRAQNGAPAFWKFAVKRRIPSKFFSDAKGTSAFVGGERSLAPHKRPKNLQ